MLIQIKTDIIINKIERTKF